MLQGRKLTRAIAYAVDTAEETNKVFIEAIHESGFEIKTKPIQTFVDGSKKADWDVGLAIDAVKLADKLDVVVLASGDGDFIPLVEYLKMRGCQVEVITFGKSASGKLKEVADDFIDMDVDVPRYVMGGNNRFERHDRREQREFVKKPEEKVQQPHKDAQNRPGAMRKVIRKLR